MPFTLKDIPDQTGKLAVITGATGGLGYETALALAGANANVVLTGRNEQRGTDALARIRAAFPRANVSYETLDVASLKSIADFARRFSAAHKSLDILVNNAGVMMLPKRMTTEDGFERQFGTNHLGHFALTEQLLPLLRAAPHPRVVTVSSLAHRWLGRMRFDDLQLQRHYNPSRAYGQSKLANLLFALELQRRSDQGGWGLTSLAAHPGTADTDLIANGPASGGRRLVAFGGRILIGLFGQDAASGALPQIYAATAPDVTPGGYYGPSGFIEMTGPPAPARINGRARN
ncbi:MAG: oxidoreductase, partial [Devosia sp.]